MRYLIAGAFSKTLPIMKFLSRYTGDADITVYDGINKCKWNGGRINRDIEYSDGVINYYCKKNIGVALTFTNHNIDLNDPVGISLLEKFHREGNSIILINEDLRLFIRNNYPKYKLIYSITGMGNMGIPLAPQDIRDYKKLGFKYDWIVPRYEHIFDDNAHLLDTSKWEVMLNDTCIWKCKHYDAHFKAIADMNTKGLPYDPAVEECWIEGFDPNKPSKYKCMDIDTYHIDKLKALGVTAFKITGREMEDDEYYNELKTYLT